MTRHAPPLTIEIGTLSLTGLGKAYGQRAAASFERALPAMLAARPTVSEIRQTLPPITMPTPGSLSAEEFGRRLAGRVARGLIR